MAVWNAGNKITSARLNVVQAKYARRSGDGTQTLNNGDTLLSFPTAVTPSTLVTPSGTGNTGFTIGEGSWVIEASVRQHDSTGGAIYICAGTPAATETQAITGQDATSIVRLASTTYIVPSGSTSTIYVVVFSGAATTVTSYGADLTHISLTRFPG